MSMRRVAQLLVMALLTMPFASAGYASVPSPVGEIWLDASSYSPSAGEVVFLTVDIHSPKPGQPVGIFVTATPPAPDGTLSGLTSLGLGRTNSAGLYSLRREIPSGQVGAQVYLIAYAIVNGQLMESNKQTLVVTPRNADAAWIVTPSTYCEVQPNGACVPTASSSPINEAYQQATAGDLIVVEDGLYQPVTLTKPEGCHSETGPMIWIKARHHGHDYASQGSAAWPAVIQRHIGSGSDTLLLKERTCWTAVVGLWVQASDRSGVFFFKFYEDDVPYDHTWFLDTVIDGEWDRYTGTGFKAKWGVLAHGLEHFRWIGGAVVRINHEHAFYLHNTTAEMEMWNVLARHNGRTALQMVARSNEGPMGTGDVRLMNVKAVDNGLADNCKGASAYSFHGRNDHHILLDHAKYEAGFDEALNAATGCDGTGAVVSYSGNYTDGIPNGPIWIRRSVFEIQDGFGDRDLVDIDKTPSLTVEDSLLKSGDRKALVIQQDTEAHCLDANATVYGAPNDDTKAYGVTYQNYATMLSAIGECAP